MEYRDTRHLDDIPLSAWRPHHGRARKRKRDISASCGNVAEKCEHAHLMNRERKMRYGGDRNTQFHLTDFSDEVLAQILRFLAPVPDLLRLSETSHRLKTLCQAPELWCRVIVPRPAYLAAPHDESGDESSDETDDGEACALPCAQKEHACEKGQYMIDGIADAATRFIAGVATAHLELLDISNLRSGRNAGDMDFHGESLRLLSTRSGKSLASFSCPPSNMISCSDLVLFVGECSNLDELSLCGVSAVTMSTLGHILRSRQSIRRISVADCDELRGTRGALWAAILPIVHHLEALDISGTQLQSLPVDELLTECPFLEELVADRCEALEIPLRFRVERQTARPIAPKLRILRLDGIRNFPAELLRLLFDRGTPLRGLSLNHIIPDGLLDVFNVLALPSLEHLALSGQNVTDKHFRDIIMHRLRLSLISLDLSKCSNLTGEPLVSAEAFSRLTKVDLSGTRFTEAAAIVLVSIAPRLEYFSLSGCRSIENRAMRRAPLEYIRGTSGL
jgi:Leucine-rich repeat (LRR) protein